MSGECGRFGERAVVGATAVAGSEFATPEGGAWGTRDRSGVFLKPNSCMGARIENEEIDPSFVVTHRATLNQGPVLHKNFRDKQDGCIAKDRMEELLCELISRLWKGFDRLYTISDLRGPKRRLRLGSASLSEGRTGRKQLSSR